jgi:hypothetical protein
MTRKRDRLLAADGGLTTQELLDAGYVSAADGQMCNGLSIKRQCTSCSRWYDDVQEVYLDTRLCWGCKRRYATGR